MRRFLFCVIGAGLIVTACNPLEKPVGGDRDEYGCLPSGGYEWSPVLEDCVRPWEVEIKLEDALVPGSERYAYLTGPGPSGLAEVRFQWDEVILLTQSEEGGYMNEEGWYLDEDFSLFDPGGERVYVRAADEPDTSP